MDKYSIARANNRDLAWKMALLEVAERIAVALERIAGKDENLGPLPGPEKFDALGDIERRRQNT